ncbi:XdhC family protein [soil metagenome]
MFNMKELLPQITQWLNDRRPFAIARVIQTWGSSPRPVGSVMLISSDMEMVGSVSGGCVEGSVLKEAQAIIKNGTAKRLSYGVSDDEAWSVGLTCGGKIQVYVESVPAGDSPQGELWNELCKRLNSNRPCILVTTLVDSHPSSTLIDERGNASGAQVKGDVFLKMKESIARREYGVVSIGENDYFIHSFSKRNRMFIIGAAHITTDLVELARQHDFETIVIDPRGIFATKTQFTVQPDQLLVKYPSEVLNEKDLDETVYAVVLSHDPKIDDDALQILLRSKAAYIGALGSRKTHEKRVERLKQAGFNEEDIRRIESPVGIDIGAQGAREIALSIMGSVIKVKNSL